MGLKAGGVRGSLRSVSTGAGSIPDSGLVHDFDAQGLTESDGATVSTFTDQEGSNDATAVGGPTMNTTGINSLQAVDLDGSSDGFDASAFALGTGDEYTFAAVFSVDSISGFNTILRQSTGGYNLDWRDASSATGSTDSWFWGHTGVTGTEFGTPTVGNYVLVRSYDGDRLAIDIDGTELVNQTGVSINSPSGTMAFGYQSGNDSRWADMHIGQFLHYDQFYDDTGRDQITNVLQSQWDF